MIKAVLHPLLDPIILHFVGFPLSFPPKVFKDGINQPFLDGEDLAELVRLYPV